MLRQAFLTLPTSAGPISTGPTSTGPTSTGPTSTGPTSAGLTSAGLTITGITADSRAVTPGCLFAALPGGREDGRRFIADAVARGAVAVLAPVGTAWPPGVPPRPLIEDANPRRALARMAAAQAGAQPEMVVAITGTNGKTSTAEFLRQIMQHTRPSASLGTLGVIAPGRTGGGGLTSPDPVALAQAMAGLAGEGVRFAAVEASSHGLDQFRLDGLRLAAAGWSNLTRDHLDYHGTMDAYRTAKLRLFAELLPPGAPAVADSNLEPASLAALRDVAARRRLRLLTVGETGDAIRLLRAIPHAGGQTLDLVADGRRRTVELKLPGRFQADNALLAAALAQALGVPALDQLAALTGVRGRMELVASWDGRAAYVDYAHTPDALERLLAALRPHTQGLLHVVFGAGGDRDAGKRPLMGAAAARGADAVIVTDDNPRSEDPAAIRHAILAACPTAREIGNRAAAIAAGLDALAPGDVLVVAGKGHEQGQTIAGHTLPFDDASIMRGLL